VRKSLLFLEKKPLLSQSREGAKKPYSKALPGVLAALREIRVSLGVDNQWLSRRQGDTEKLLKRMALYSSAPPRLCERMGFRPEENPMFSGRRRDAEKTRWTVT
jgi:hypothetical protein